MRVFDFCLRRAVLMGLLPFWVKASLLFSLTAQPLPAQGVFLSNSEGIPALNGGICQLDTSRIASIQTRNTVVGGGDWRGISQSFLWAGSECLDGVGLHLSSEQTSWSYDQQYVFSVQRLGDTSVPLETISWVEFTMEKEAVVGDQWLYFDLAVNLDLEEGERYGFTLCPVSNDVAGTRMYWSASAGNVYSGSGAQINPQVDGMPKTNAYISQGVDLAFYLVSTDVILSNIEDVPAVNTGVAQVDVSATSPIQTRNTQTGGSDWRGISQSFQWSTESKLDGVGFHINSAQTTWAYDQQYQLVIQKLTGDKTASTATVAQIEFTMQKENVVSNQWLYIDLVSNLNMDAGQWYGVTLCPVSNDVAGTRMYWSASASNVYSGAGAQINPLNDGMPKTNAYISQGVDLAFYLVSRDVVLSNTEDIPVLNMGVAQLDTRASNPIQTRNTQAGASDWRGISQSFQWNTENELDGVGFHISSAQTSWAYNQQYQLVIQKLTGDKTAPTATVAEVEFTMEKENVVGGQWLYIDLVSNLNMDAGQWYGVTLCPVSNDVAGARMYWSASASNVYSGAGAQINPLNDGMPKTNAYISQGVDLAFYLQSRGEFVPEPWVYVGNELLAVVDGATGKTVNYLTDGNSVDSHFHYHGGSWGIINEREYLFFSSSRNKPALAGPTVDGERQIVAADVDNGDLYYLTTIPCDGISNLSHLSSRPYYATYNDRLKTVFYFNKARTKLYAYDCLSGEQRLLIMLPVGASSRGMDDWANDQLVRIVYEYTSTSPAGQIGFIAVADFDLNLNLISNSVVEQCVANEALNHVEICPANKDLFFYKHHTGLQPDGSYTNVNLYLMDLSSESIQLAKSDEDILDHMVWGQSGDYIYWDSNRNLYRYDWATDAAVVVGEQHTGHNKLSRDENLWVHDGRSSFISSSVIDGVYVDQWTGFVSIYNLQTGVSHRYANYIWGGPHPRHPHALFSTDDSMISFVTGAAGTNENTRIAIMDVDE